MNTKWQMHVYPIQVANVAPGMVLSFAANGHDPMSQVAYVSINGMIMAPIVAGQGDYTLNLDGNGNVDGITFDIQIYAGDRIAYYGEKAITLQS